MGVLQEAGKVLVLNAGSSSLKFKLFNLAPTFAADCGGMIDRIGEYTYSYCRCDASWRGPAALQG